MLSAVAALPVCSKASTKKSNDTTFKYCLNTSTISGQGVGLEGYIDIAGQAGYDGIELWISDIQDYIKKGKSLRELRARIEKNNLVVENAIGFAEWIVDDERNRRDAFLQVEQEMNMMAELGCKRIAAPPAGANKSVEIDLFKVSERYRDLLLLGGKTGVIPQLEVWGSSTNLYHLGQAMFVAMETNHPKARILADVYHLYRGGTDFEGLRLMSGAACEIFHMNDYPADPRREEIGDSDRVFPGDGVAPLQSILEIFKEAGGTKVLSLELFNCDYWRRDAFDVAEEGLKKMQNLVSLV